MLFGNDARKEISKGIDIISKNVEITYGPLGKNFAIQCSDNMKNPSMITKDGVTVAKYTQSKDRLMLIAFNLLSSVSNSSNKFAGDGTTTSLLLTGRLIKRGNSYILSGYDSSNISRGITFAKDIILKIFDKIRISITSKKQLYDLCMITSAKDSDLSNIVSNAIYECGNAGQVIIEESIYEENILIVSNSLNLVYGIADKSLLGNKAEVVVKYPLILIFKSKLNDQNIVQSAFDFAIELKKPLIIFSAGISESIASYMIQYNKNNKDSLTNVSIYIFI